MSQISVPTPTQSTLAAGPATQNTSSSRMKTRSATRKPKSGPSSDNALEYDLLLAKIIHYCHDYVPAAKLASAKRHQPNALKKPWVTERSQVATKHGKIKRNFVLDGNTWTLKQFDTVWECKDVSRSKSWIDAGNGVRIFYKENEKWRLFTQGFQADCRLLAREWGDNEKADALSLPNARTPQMIKSEAQQDMLQFKKKAGVNEKIKDGSPIFLHVCGALERIRAGKL
ncbi:hypothetical protein K504DRAFT_534429 [Pleomassaria siparia CBS 279.74]|uniref:Uncharacterized protein n=1 Tax=Pleomassaria siparia CBS 279.74 TaxID=1314801 RepID=A0A6G1K8B4_9PLEO|nr:hypothetical protein K504DRAFT_534429 [Pleomassaria siparia CBS 279.74]